MLWTASFSLFLFWETTEIYFSGEYQCSVCYRRAFPNLRATIGLGYIGFGWYIPPLTGPLVSLNIAQINTKKNCFTFTSDHSVYDCIRLDTWMIPNQTKSLEFVLIWSANCFIKDSEPTTALQPSRIAIAILASENRDGEFVKHEDVLNSRLRIFSQNQLNSILINCGLCRLLPFRNPRLAYPDLYVIRGFFITSCLPFSLNFLANYRCRHLKWPKSSRDGRTRRLK